MRVRSLWTTIVLLGIAVGAVGAQTVDGVRLEAESITVIPFVNDSGDPQWDSLATAMSSTIRLSTQLSGQFDYRHVEPFDPYAERGSLRLARVARENRIDAVVFGRVARDVNGRITLTAAVYGNEQGRIIGEETREAFGDFDVLDAADELVLLSTSAILGYRVDYGAILLQPNRQDIPYRVYIDGIPVGESLEAVPLVLVGRRTVEISVSGRRGEQFIYSADRLVRPGEALDVVFDLPNVLVGSVDEIAVHQDLAESLLGQYGDLDVAREALAQSAAMLGPDASGVRAEQAIEQEILETAWDLEEEFIANTPGRYALDGEYTAGSPFTFVARSRELAESRDIGDSRLNERIQRNGAAHLLMLQLRWAQLLAEERWEDAQVLLGDMDVIEETFGLSEYLRVSQLQRSLESALRTYETYEARRSRPWPYATGALGIGIAGYGGYLLATDVVGRTTDDADGIYGRYLAETDPAEVVRLRDEANDTYDEAELFELIQWTSIAVGGIVAVVSAIRVVQNRRAGDVYLPGWARERYGRLMDVAEAVFSGDGTQGTQTVLVLGPYAGAVRLADRIDLLPLLGDAVPGEPFFVSRPRVVAEDASRLMDDSSRLVVLR